MSIILDLTSKIYILTFLSEEKLDPNGPAYKKWKQSKKFDPSRSEVLRVMKAQEAGPRHL